MFVINYQNFWKAVYRFSRNDEWISKKEVISDEEFPNPKGREI